MDSSARYALPLKTAFVHKERHTDVRIWPATAAADTVILFICGNPGLVDYYLEFLSTIHASSPSNYEVIGVGHEGHSPDQPLPLTEGLNLISHFGQRALPTLAEQVERKIAYVDHIHSEHKPGIKLVLIGHSVGAYICQEVLRARPDLIHAVYGLFPTIAHIRRTPNGQRLGFLFKDSTIALVSILLNTLNWLVPYTLLHALVRVTTAQKPPASIVTTKLICSPSTVSAAIAMGRDEMHTILDLDTEFLLAYGHKITLYFAAGATDSWVGNEERVAEITKALDKSKTSTDNRRRWYVCEEGMEHAFCLEHSALMAKLCASWLSLQVQDDTRP